jgi:hypothetical protein
MSSYWQQPHKIYGEWRFDSWLEVQRWKSRLRDERRSRSFDQIHMFVDDAKLKLQHKTFSSRSKTSVFQGRTETVKVALTDFSRRR